MIKLADKFNISSQTVNYKIKNLMKKGIILAFRVGIDISKLGLQNCMIDIYLKDHNRGNGLSTQVLFEVYLQ